MWSDRSRIKIMQLSTVITLARTFAQTDLNGLTDFDAINLATEAQTSMVFDLVKRGIDAASVVEAYLNATTQVGIYSWPDGATIPWVNVSTGGTAPTLLFLKTINVNYIDSTAGNYVEPSLVDSGNLPVGTSYQQMRSHNSKNVPMLENRGSTFEIYPAPNATNGDNLIKFFTMLYFVVPTAFVATSDIVSYLISLNPSMLAWRMAYTQAMRGNEEAMSRAKGYLSEYSTSLNTTENILKQGSEKPINATGVQLTGFEF